jgi:hypothetical protein
MYPRFPPLLPLLPPLLPASLSALPILRPFINTKNKKVLGGY